MPQVTVYIRAEDMDAWKAIEKKSEFIHNALNDGRMPFLEAQRIPEIVRTKWEKANEALSEAKVSTEGRYVATPEGIYGPTKLESKAQKFCKEGHPIPVGRDKCLGKGCKHS